MQRFTHLCLATICVTACGVELDTEHGPEVVADITDDGALEDGPVVDDASEDMFDENNLPPGPLPIHEEEVENADVIVCPAGVTCIEDLPFRAITTTAGGTDRFDRYNCSTSNESGPERIYRVLLPGAGTVSVTLDAALEAGNTDIDVHILSSLSAQACLARGDTTATASLAADEVFIVFDTFRRSNGTEGVGRFSGLITYTPLPDTENNPLIAAGVPAAVAELAMVAWRSAEEQDLTDSSVFTVIDFSKPSSSKRLWTVDLESGELLASHRVTHGIGSNSSSDPARAVSFSNVSGSNKSSLGLARTAETYTGRHGLSLRLDGLEPSNSRIRSRAVVVHGADYAEDAFVNRNGYLGRSNGCPAIAQSRSRAFINLIKGGTLMFSYYPSDSWLNSSPFLN